MEWILVKDRPCPLDTAILVYAEGTVAAVTLQKNEHDPDLIEVDVEGASAFGGEPYCQFSAEQITHWMALPELPKD